MRCRAEPYLATPHFPNEPEDLTMRERALHRLSEVGMLDQLQGSLACRDRLVHPILAVEREQYVLKNLDLAFRRHWITKHFFEVLSGFCPEFPFQKLKATNFQIVNVVAHKVSAKASIRSSVARHQRQRVQLWTMK